MKTVTNHVQVKKIKFVEEMVQCLFSMCVSMLDVFVHVVEIIIICIFHILNKNRNFTLFK